MSTAFSRKLTPEHRQRRLSRVHVLRLALPAAAVLSLVAVVGQVTWRSLQAGAASAPITSADTQMVNPQFSGAGRDGSHYLLTAQSGLRDPKDDARILLDKPVVTVTRAGGDATRTVSKSGVFRQDNQTLSLDGDVKVDQAGGFQFVANNAVIDTSTGQVVGGGVQGQSATGAVKSDSYAVSDKGDRMVFKGGVHTQLKGK